MAFIIHSANIFQPTTWKNITPTRDTNSAASSCEALQQFPWNMPKVTHANKLQADENFPGHSQYATVISADISRMPDQRHIDGIYGVSTGKYRRGMDVLWILIMPFCVPNDRVNCIWLNEGNFFGRKCMAIQSAIRSAALNGNGPFTDEQFGYWLNMSRAFRTFRVNSNCSEYSCEHITSGLFDLEFSECAATLIWTMNNERHFIRTLMKLSGRRRQLADFIDIKR